MYSEWRGQLTLVCTNLVLFLAGSRFYRSQPLFLVVSLRNNFFSTGSHAPGYFRSESKSCCLQNPSTCLSSFLDEKCILGVRKHKQYRCEVLYRCIHCILINHCFNKRRKNKKIKLHRQPKVKCLEIQLLA